MLKAQPWRRGAAAGWTWSATLVVVLWGIPTSATPPPPKVIGADEAGTPEAAPPTDDDAEVGGASEAPVDPALERSAAPPLAVDDKAIERAVRRVLREGLHEKAQREAAGGTHGVSRGPAATVFHFDVDTEVSPARHDPAFKRFKQRAFRLRRLHPLQRFNEPFILAEQSFEVWAPENQPIDRSQALERMGREELAGRQRLGTTVKVGGWVVAGIVVAGGLLLGSAGSVALLAMTLDPNNPATALGPVVTVPLTMGLTLGLLASLVVIPVGYWLAGLVGVSNAEMLSAVQAYNTRLAEDEGLDEADIPFSFLGY